ncbi:MAG: phenylalanine--tRNA ligase subunit beta [Thermoplasmatota archaeon]
MPVIHFDVRELERLLGKEVPRDELARDIPMIGADVDSVEGDAWAIEFFPNRPDLYTVEGVARAMRQFYGIEPGLKEYKVARGKHSLFIDASVAEVRPAVAGGFVRGIDMTEARLAALIELQEDLHWGLGARRRKVAIGVHDARDLRPPFFYLTTPPDGIRFVPLQDAVERSPAEILAAHPKGRDYAHLLAGKSRYPLILDREGRVLSLPPIINGTLTALTTATRDAFIDVTGSDQVAVEKALNIIATSLAESGATLETVTLKRLKDPAPAGKQGAAERLEFLKRWSKDSSAWTRVKATPDLAAEKRKISASEVNRLLGTDFKAAEIAASLERMGYGATPGKANVTVRVPSYRVDVMHEWDLIEDVAIGHRIDRFTEAAPRAVTFGASHPGVRVAERARSALIGLGFLEIMSLSLSNERDQFIRMGLPRGWSVDVKNALTEDHTLLRVSLLPSLLNILKANAHRDLPQRFFEVGNVTREGSGGRPTPERRVAGVIASSRASFSEVKGVALALARDLAVLPLSDVAAAHAVEKAEVATFIAGRAARVKGLDGTFGEVAPATLEAFGLGAPVAAFEFRLGPAGAFLSGDAAETKLAHR